MFITGTPTSFLDINLSLGYPLSAFILAKVIKMLLNFY